MRYPRLTTTTILIYALCACSAVPTPPMPDGRARVPVNSPSKIDEYRTRAAVDAAQARNDSDVRRQLNAVKRDLADLRGTLVAMAATQDSARLRDLAEQPVRPTRPNTAASYENSVSGWPSGETIEVHEQSLLFRVARAHAETDFTVSPALKELVLNASRAAGRIEIRGRTDAAKADPANDHVALARALAARRFLISSGVPIAKISISHLAAGGFVADNDSPAGKARNRRVEIETMDLPAAALVAANQLTQGDPK